MQQFECAMQINRAIYGHGVVASDSAAQISLPIHCIHWALLLLLRRSFVRLSGIVGGPSTIEAEHLPLIELISPPLINISREAVSDTS